MKVSAGVILYKYEHSDLKVLLVHPSGHYNANSPYSIPKGEQDEGESLETTARRELFEETGLLAPKMMCSIGKVVYPNNKKEVHAWVA